MNNASWFAVDRVGLRKLIEDRPRSSCVFELIQNAWDEATKNVEVTLEMLTDQKGRARLIVSDDNPTGFADITHAYTMFASSNKKSKAEARGRFNLGEKLVLALCTEAKISTTTGTIVFHGDGTRTQTRERTQTGSVFSAIIYMTKPQYAEACAAVETMIPPAGIVTRFNSKAILDRTPLTEFVATLPTVIGDDEGVLRKSVRKTVVRIYEPFPGETPMIYELGIPVVESGGAHHVDVQQKVPLNQDRDNVPPAYLRTIRAAVLNSMYESIKGDSAREVWVDHALTAPEVEPEAVKAIVVARYGENAVTASVTDHEANKRALDSGATLITGSAFSKDAWSNIRDAGFLQSAGKVFATGTGIGGGTIDGDEPAQPAKPVPESEYTPGMHDVVRITKDIAKQVIGVEIGASILMGPVGDRTMADYGGNQMRFNLRTLGRAWFAPTNLAAILDLLIHELAHNRAKDHLSEQFYRECTRIGGKVAALALARPELFQFEQSASIAA